MQKNSKTETRRSLLFCLAFFGLVAALVILPYQFRSQAGGQAKNTNDSFRTESHVEGLENYDIRADKSAFEKIARFRQSLNRDAAAVADVRERFVAGEAALKERVPTLKVEYNTDIRTPEVIAPDVAKGRSFLTGSSSEKHSEILRGFVKENESLIGVSDAQADALRVTADYANPDGNLSYAHLEQFINDVPVFRGEVKAGFTKEGEMIRVINNLAAGLDYQSLSSDFGNPVDAVKTAAGYINNDMSKLDLRSNSADSNNLKAVFGRGASVTTAERMYFPTEPGVAVPAWRVLIYQQTGAYYVIVEAETGAMLWRKNIAEDQTQAATYNVYANPNAMIDVADSPFPITPGPTSPTLGIQGAGISRVNRTLIGNEAPYTFNNLGWITDGNNTTDGNNVEAGLDRKLPNTGSPANPNDTDPDGRAVGNPNRVFNFSYTPGNPNTNTGDSPLPAGQTPTGCLPAANTDLPTDFQKGITTQLFYISNRYHDELYLLGFTEAARNFQNDNFGRGGAGGDRVAAQAQDCSGTNNANFTTPADGSRPTMQMYLWTGPTPDFDGSLDADVIIHEYTHGVSNRLHGNSAGLTTNMSRGMGEGWGDFYGHAILSEPTDPINGIYTTGAYDTYLATAGFTGNAYYGIRRFPKAVRSFTGGPNNRPHNPLTFADVDSTQLNISDGAFPRGPFGVSTADQVHNLGEIWSSALWEVRALMVTRLGWAVGNRKVLQLVTDGMKLAPLGPTMLQERDAIIAAAQASSIAPEAGPDVADVWAGFAIRGMGFSASIQNQGTGANNTRVTEAFDSPNLLQAPTFTVSDAGGNNNGFPEPGETLTLTIPLTNNTGNPATNVTLQVVGGGTANYGTIANNETVSRTVSYTVPADAPCGSVLTLTFNVTSSLGATSFTRQIIIGQPVATLTENFDGVTAPALPAGWTAVAVSGGVNFVTTTINPDSAPNSAFALNPATVGGGTDLTSPSTAITAPAATVSFRHRFDTEAGWDGGALEISIGAGAFQDIIAAGGSFVENGYTGVLGAGTNNPLANRNAWSGLSNGYITTTVRLPAAAAGQSVRLKWRFGADDNTVGTGPNPGWNIDNIRVNGTFTCGPVVPSGDAVADFDGDGRTDLSVFRPGNNTWYIQRSTAGFSAVAFGTATDQLAPGDYDGDGKADQAVFRDGTWYALLSSNSSVVFISFGQAGDVAVPGDYDGDGKADQAVFRAGTWYARLSGGGTAIIPFGQAGDTPVVGDFDGDGKDDQAVFRAGQWYIRQSSGGVRFITFGQAGDAIVQADYDGDGKTDPAVFRAGTWYALLSSNGSTAIIAFGQAGDVPAPGDYDGDGTDDQAVFRNGTWYIRSSAGGVQFASFGAAGDRPIPTEYLP